LFSSYDLFIMTGIFFFSITIPLSTRYSARKNSNGRKYVTWYGLGMILIALISIALFFTDGHIFNGFTTIYIFAFVGFQWLGNALLIK
jgi:hypothetical protein